VVEHESAPWPPRLELMMPMWMSVTGAVTRAVPGGQASRGLGGCCGAGPPLGSTQSGLTRRCTRSGTAAPRISCLSAIDRELSIISSRSILLAIAGGGGGPDPVLPVAMPVPLVGPPGPVLLLLEVSTLPHAAMPMTIASTPAAAARTPRFVPRSSFMCRSLSTTKAGDSATPAFTVDGKLP
jgi:hypothetical protein